jgi:uncharacterized membrane protein YfcA
MGGLLPRSDHLEGILVHLQNHDNTDAAVARAPIEEIEVVRKRMGWKFPWVSSHHSDFNYDFNVRARQAPYCIETDQHGHIIMSPLTGFLGVGGGFPLVPAMILFARLPMAVTVGTSLAVIAANSFAG